MCKGGVKNYYNLKILVLREFIEELFVDVDNLKVS